MTGAQLQSFASSLMNGQTISDDLFYVLLNVARSNRELERPWKVLTKIDKTQTAQSTDTFLTSKNLPSDFRRFLNEGVIYLFDNVNNVYNYEQIPQEQQLDFKNDYGKFYADFANNTFYLMGTQTNTFSIWIPYIANYGDITSTTSWQKFPSEFHPLLAFDVVSYYTSGVDYDDQNARMSPEHKAAAQLIHTALIDWDSELAIGAINRLDYNNRSTFRSGSIDISGNSTYPR